MRTLLSLLATGLLLTPQTSTFAAEYSRYALDAVTIGQGVDNERNLNVGGPELDLFDDADVRIPSSYALAPFQFYPRDFSLSRVDAINSLSLGIRNDLSFFTEEGKVDVFFVPDSRLDFGVPLTRDGEDGDCTFFAPHDCYDELSYAAGTSNGIDGTQFSAAPILIGEVDVPANSPPAVGDPLSSDFEKVIVDLNNDASAGLLTRINAGLGFHLLFGAQQSEDYIEIGSFNNNYRDPGADIRPQLIIDASGLAAGVTKDLNHSGSIHPDGDAVNGDFYGSGNDDNFSEYGIANFQFSKSDFGVDTDISELGSVELTLTHSERSFTDGEEVEFFFTADTADSIGYDDELGYANNLTYDSELDNGLDAGQYGNAPISLGVYDFQAKNGGNADTFDLQLPEDAKAQLIGAINDDTDFHIIIATTDSENDITFGGKDNSFDPGNPQLTISLTPVDPGNPLDLNGDGDVNADDAALFCDAEPGLNVLGGDTDFNGTVEFADFLTLSANFGQAGHFGQGDFDCSGDVGFADFLTLSSNFGVSAGGAQPVPEPATHGLLLLAGLSMVALRRRRS